jgi:phage tail sheath protein FI
MDYKSYLHQGLLQTSPTYTDVLNKITEIENLLPPSAAMAGVFTTVDNTRGVWKSPANISLSSVVKPSYNISQKENESLNVDIISGKSINAIRIFSGFRYPGVGSKNFRWKFQRL